MRIETYKSLRGYDGTALLVGITYDTKTKAHSCRIECLPAEY